MNVYESFALRAVPWAIPFFTIGIFLFDYATPVGVAVSMLYIIPLLMTYFTSVTRREHDPLYFSLIATVLLWINFFLKPAGLPIAYGVFNRVLGIFILWAVAVALIRFKRMQREIAETAAAKEQSTHELQTEQVERAHAEALMEAAQEARAHADVASLGAAEARRKAEENLLSSQQRLKAIIESAMDAIITVDEGQQIVMFNRAAEEMFGCPAHGAVGQPLDRFLPARFRDAHRDHIHTFGQSGVTSR
ncbi:MAG TPA: PAS domain S-box protein, partial [Nitrospira sp.]|nr:PAS domain S-box protein [Nitrospira sp.]